MDREGEAEPRIFEEPRNRVQNSRYRHLIPQNETHCVNDLLLTSPLCKESTIDEDILETDIDG